MLDRIKTLFSELSSTAETTPREFSKALAAAALMVEAAHMDETFGEEERQTISRLVQEKFGLSAEEAASLIAEAETAQSEANHLLRFTRSIKDGYSFEDRVELIEMLWEVAYSDGELDKYEANLLRRVGGLIYVSDRDSGDARKRVLARLGLAED
jgi:uncharacterized tellurite resistance protein B-like protein